MRASGYLFDRVLKTLCRLAIKILCKSFLDISYKNQFVSGLLYAKENWPDVCCKLTSPEIDK